MKANPPVNAEYASLCAQAGETQFNIEVLKANLVGLNNRINQIRQEQEIVARAEASQRPVNTEPVSEAG